MIRILVKIILLKNDKGKTVQYQVLKSRRASKKLAVIGKEGKLYVRTCSDRVNKFIIMLFLIFHVFAFTAYIKA